MKPKAYSYVRFSTPDQAKDDSLRRQMRLTVEYAERHGLELDTDLTFQNLGLSAYHGANVYIIAFLTNLIKKPQLMAEVIY
jgi:hypothetical protein